MLDHFLLTTQGNEVLLAIERAGLKSAEFKWDKALSRFAGFEAPYYVPVLVHDPSGSSFTFDYDREAGQHYAIFTPGEEAPQEEERVGSWSSQLLYVRTWLGYVKREYQAPDLWGELGRQRELAGGELPEAENTPFTPDERLQIEAQLRETKALVRKSFELTEAQYRAVEDRLDYLAEAARHMRRIDWRNAFAGVFLTAVVNAVVPGDVVRDVLGLSLRGLAGLFGVDIPALPS